jgi:hypothetical protein
VEGYDDPVRIARSGFSFDISFYPAKVGSIDKAKTSVTVVEKSTGLRGIKVQGFPIHGIKTERSIHMSLSLYDFKQKGFLSVKHRDSK